MDRATGLGRRGVPDRSRALIESRIRAARRAGGWLRGCSRRLPQPILVRGGIRAGRRATAMIEAAALVKAAHGLDPLPATVARLASLVVRPDWSLNEAAHLVEFDPALTGRLLRLANSAAMAGLSPVNTARDEIGRA